MSGHSHFKKIKHTKALEDKKRSQIFSKLAKEIEIAARKGADPETNSALRFVIEKAKKLNLPKENIEKAVKRGTGEISAEKLEEVLYEGYGPGGVAIIIEGITDNKKRALEEIRQVLKRNGGKLADKGAVKWMFEKKGAITINQEVKDEKQKENLELAAIEAGAQDICWQKDVLEIYTKTEDLEKIKKNLEEKGIKVDSVSLDWVAKEEISLDKKDKEACQKLFSELDELDSVQEIYSNLKM